MKETPNRLDQPLQDIADAIANPLLQHLEDCTEVEEKELWKKYKTEPMRLSKTIL